MTPARIEHRINLTSAEVRAYQAGERTLRRVVAEASVIGMEAIELIDYLFTPNDMSEMRIHRLLDRWHGEDDFLDWVKEEWRKERNAES